MTAHLPLEQFVATVKTWQAGNADSYTDSPTIRMMSDGGVTFSARESKAGTPSPFGGVVNEARGALLSYQGLGQLAERMDAPSLRWLGDPTHCPPALRAEIMNAIIATRPSRPLFMREHEGTLRAVLSDEYTRFDHQPFVDLVAQAVERSGVPAQVWRADVADEMRAYVLLPSVTFGELPSADGPGFGNGGLHPAIYISNSEIGTGKARVSGGVYRATCSNGMIYGWQADDVVGVRHIHIHESALFAVIASAVANGFKLSQKAAEEFMASQETHLQPESLKSLVGEWTRKYGITVERGEDWLAAISTESATYGRPDDPRLFDAVNALTFVAREKEPVERELLERTAGDLLRTSSGYHQVE